MTAFSFVLVLVAFLLCSPIASGAEIKTLTRQSEDDGNVWRRETVSIPFGAFPGPASLRTTIVRCPPVSEVTACGCQSSNNTVLLRALSPIPLELADAFESTACSCQFVNIANFGLGNVQLDAYAHCEG